jgi:hypothetical protein
MELTPGYEIIQFKKYLVLLVIFAMIVVGMAAIRFYISES